MLISMDQVWVCSAGSSPLVEEHGGRTPQVYTSVRGDLPSHGECSLSTEELTEPYQGRGSCP